MRDRERVRFKGTACNIADSFDREEIGQRKKINKLEGECVKIDQRHASIRERKVNE